LVFSYAFGGIPPRTATRCFIGPLGYLELSLADGPLDTRMAQYCLLYLDPAVAGGQNERGRQGLPIPGGMRYAQAAP
jgi:hypothetical protein